MITEELKIFVQENQEEVKNLLWILCEIPAPSHHEERRAAFIKDWLEKQGAEGVFIDEAKKITDGRIINKVTNTELRIRVSLNDTITEIIRKLNLLT